MPRVLFFYDYLSPYTYVASTQIDRVCRAHGIEASWEPALLGAIMKATGNQPPAVLPARGEYMAKDLPRWAAHHGIPYRWSEHFPFSSVAALRAALAVRAKAPSAFAAWNEACFRAAWAESKNLADPAVLGEIAVACRIDPQLVITANDDPAWKEALKAQTARALETGAFGLPWTVVEEGASIEGYFGNDRLPLVGARLARGKPWDA